MNLKAAIKTGFLTATAIICVSLVGCGKKETKRDKYEICAEFDGETIEGTLIYSFGNGKFPDDRMAFNLYANAYREGAKFTPASEADAEKAFPGGPSYGHIEILSAEVNGKSVDYEVIGEDMNVLYVSTPDVQSKDAQIKIHFKTIIPDGKNRLGKDGERVKLADFFPVACVKEGDGFYECTYSPYGDPYYSESCDYEFSLTVPSVYTVAASGFPEQTTVDGEKTTYDFSLDGGRDFAFALGKDYNVTSKNADGITVNYYSSEENNALWELAADCLRFFGEKFGSYPYKSFSVAEVGLVAGGMEYSGLCYISDELDQNSKRYAVIHETAHEWWHAGVGNNQTECGWLDEGLCEYSTYLYLSERGFQDEAESMIENAKSAYKSFFELKELLAGNKDTSMDRALKDYTGKYEYVNIAYNKALIMFKEYENAAGREKTVKRLKNYYLNNLFSNAAPENLIENLGMGEFFRSYAEGKVLI